MRCPSSLSEVLELLKGMVKASRASGVIFGSVESRASCVFVLPHLRGGVVRF